ncbi:MAG TPA: SDR family oxidoreductase [Solirubrobacterales bacterium]|nr:SDR family oxidoreductase [Solirubrobacterales bacterium]
MSRLDDMRALVTGCSSGIGQATALALREAGAEVFATARRLEGLADLGPIDADHRLVLDVTDPAAIERALATAGPLDVLVNNAGFALMGAIEEVSDEELREQYEVNVFGPWRLCRAVLPAMRERGVGTIVNVSSYGAEMPYPGIGAYRSSKAALEAMSSILHLEVARFGVRVMIVQPGLVDTAFPSAAIEPRVTLADYRAVRDAADRAYDRMSPPPGLGPEAVASALVAALERGQGPLRVAVGADAERNLAAVRSGQEAFERYLDEQLRLEWR